MKNYIPDSEEAKVIWLMNFDAEFAPIATLLGCTAADVADVHNYYLSYKYGHDLANMFKSLSSERVHFKDLIGDGPLDSSVALPAIPALPTPPPVIVAGVFIRIRILVRRIKTHPNYTEAIGHRLGIITPKADINIDKVTPVITNIAKSDFDVNIRWKKGNMHGIVIYRAVANVDSESGDTSGLKWVEIGRDFRSPYIDTKQNISKRPEARYYKFRYIYKDQIVGQESDIVKVVAEIY